MATNSTDLERMIIAIDAQTERLRTELKKGERQVASFERNTNQRLKKVDRGFAALGAAAARMKKQFGGLAAGLAAGLGVNSAVSGAKAALTEFDALAKQADTVGLSTEFFQTLQLATEEASISQALLNSSLIAFAKRIGEARAGTGSLITVFKKLRPDLLQQLTSVESQEEAFKLLATAVKETDSAQEKAALAAAAFSRAGVQLVRVLQIGADGLEETRKKALDLGIVIEEHVLRNAEKLANDFGVASFTIDRQFKQTLIDLAPVIVSTAQGLSALARGVREIIDQFRSADQLGRNGLTARADALRKEIAELEKASDPSQQNLVQRFAARINPGNFSEPLKKARAELADIEQRLFKLQTRVIPTPQPVSAPTAATSTSRSTSNAAAKLVTQRQAAERTLSALNSRMLQETGRTREALMVEHQRELAQFRKLLDDKLITQNEFETARQNLSAITARRISELQTNEFEIATDAVELFTSRAEQAFDNWIETGKLGTKELVRSMLADLARLSFRQALNPLQGGITSLFSSFFGGFRASGGPVSPRKAFVVGERGPELFVPKVAGDIVPSLAGESGSGAGGMSVSFTNIINADGAVEGTAAQIAKALEANNRKLERDLPGMMANVRRRFE